MSQYTPTKIEPFNSTEISIHWNTGEQFAVPYFELRFQCPCAGCVDEKSGKRTLKREQIRPDIKPLDVVPVGRYAIQFNWSDKHITGMYHFETLFSICQAYGRRF